MTAQNPTTAMEHGTRSNVKAFKLNYSTPNQQQPRISSNPRNRQLLTGTECRESGCSRMQFRIRVFRILLIQNGQIGVQNIGNGNVVAARLGPRRRDAAYLQTQLLIAQKEEAGIQLQAEEFDLMAAAADLDEIEEVNANCILMANLQQASTSGGGNSRSTSATVRKHVLTLNHITHNKALEDDKGQHLKSENERNIC
ncbi:hypothetical protein Tco_0087651 [Tanacetum coccineum]